MNNFELDSGFEVLPTDDEYLDMKSAYKAGKSDYKSYGWEPCMAGPPPLRYNPEILQEHYINGWLYQQWLTTNKEITNNEN